MDIGLGLGILMIGVGLGALLTRIAHLGQVRRFRDNFLTKDEPLR